MVISWDRIFLVKLAVAQLVNIDFFLFQVLKICTAVKIHYFSVKVKVKQSRDRSGVALSVPGS